ncbi:SDR family NAD(P)-dependent oxidoreductase [Phytoactinopolyspora halotolerans]|uniref:SDR family oxidoreductase n=1 Tax=Phytoactinopolyspora halotolerans TaxID=1981512 RepID=A0A6L9S2G6_9ACTN|nr:SDR family oxidoreductase [Phytoactinopolyspora halotolerans]NED98731.1 SDR family oxidoreductase [Phytoactinopolyspora halotolerans]
MSPTHDTGRVVAVTGGAAGIGEAAVLHLARGGDTVVALDRNADALERLVQAGAAEGLRVESEAVDVSDDEQMAAVAERIAGRHGGADVLVCAAGVQRYGTVDQTSKELYDEVMDVNVRGVFAACREFVPLLRRRGGGAIVVVASVQAFAVQSGVAAYAASKGALVALVKAMAVDHAAEGIRVNTVCPGSVDTPMLRWAAERFADDGRSPDQLVADWGRSHPIGRVATSAEVAQAIAYLAGPEAGFVTGTELRVDGGLTAALSVALPQ